MTSREQTGLLSKDHEADAHVTWRDRLTVALFAPLTAPFLLKSLRGGSHTEKARLLARLDLPEDALPHLGSWKADTGLLHLIVDTIEDKRPRHVVEFGCGASSLIIAAALKKAGLPPHLSFDQHADFVASTKEWLGTHGLDADIRHAALKPNDDWPGLFYDTGPVADSIDLLIIDGPPWTLHPQTRGAADRLFAQLAPGATVLLDDASRPGERLIARRWTRENPDIDFRLWKGGEKGTLIGTKRG
ncbi:class I SAM-dependent methyltransferase [Sphingomicrobium clamense]|uniref:Class I SAM-dependent methyltransferase n=1 Tax=Sphingomicrobium clamense TaxID=2851013 RepID=A0ABS6V825_9SPHN|nr:class I SAM-dependent methyltransferase [Sphingomicrobium sp. B8]MBW0145724.1 class I SAM-dependent methyltransferase [Sphingomicrobium sp. B8]